MSFCTLIFCLYGQIASHARFHWSFPKMEMSTWQYGNISHESWMVACSRPIVFVILNRREKVNELRKQSGLLCDNNAAGHPIDSGAQLSRL
jgi:hypothetical protein